MDAYDVQDVWDIVPDPERVVLQVMTAEGKFENIVIPIAKLNLWSKGRTGTEEYEQAKRGTWVFWRSILDGENVPAGSPKMGDQVIRLDGVAGRGKGEVWVLDNQSRVWLFESEYTFEAHMTAINPNLKVFVTT